MNEEDKAHRLDIEDEIARIEEAHERTAWGQRLYDMEGD